MAKKRSPKKYSAKSANQASAQPTVARATAKGAALHSVELLSPATSIIFNPPTVVSHVSQPAVNDSTVATNDELSSTTVQSSTSANTNAKPLSLPAEERHRQIAKAAFERALSHGLGRTNPLEDWLWAEQHIDSQLAATGLSTNAC